MRKGNIAQDELSTQDAQERMYKRRLKEMEKTKGLSRGDLIKRATKLSIAREGSPRRRRPVGTQPDR
jgi:hypothetical protein